MALALVLSSIASLALAREPQAPPEVELYVFVHYAATSTPPTWDDAEDDYRFTMGGVRWPSLPITFYIDDGVPTGAINAINAGFDTTWEDWGLWTGDTPANVFSYGSVLPVLASGPYRDGYNTVFWQPLKEGVLGATYVWSIPALKEIVEFDIILNSTVNWTTYDLWSVAAHEAGHGLALDDLRPPKDAWLTMYAYTWPGDTRKQTLGYGDYLGMRDLYDI